MPLVAQQLLRNETAHAAVAAGCLVRAGTFFLACAAAHVQCHTFTADVFMLAIYNKFEQSSLPNQQVLGLLDE